jgi:hypothetical protein
MSKYDKDRSFTNYVHEFLAIPLIYDKLGWKIKNIDPAELERKDLNEGIDYVLNDDNGKLIYVQERFRDAYYKNYNDATLRFRRDSNTHPERIESEFYKIKADFLVYGITNGKKFKDKRHTLTDFIKWVILDLRFIRDKYKNAEIEIVKSHRKTCWIENNVLKCPENFNPDGSSSFVPFDIKLIFDLWGKDPIIAQKGFL